MNRTLFSLLLGLTLSPVMAAEPSARPNVLFILADDLGFADVGCYGGEIATPNLDRLAANGVRFTQFYNTARCWPTRAALLTGHYPQRIRMDPPRGLLPEWTRLLPHYLKPLGYRSYHSGKWHVNGAPRPLADGGFDRLYRLEDHDRNFYPTNHWLDDVQLPPVARGSNYYTTTAFANFMIECLKQHAEKFSAQPFFAYLAFTAPHFPLQAPPEDIARYRDKYLAGWDVIRRQRYEKQLKLGVVNCALSGREPGEGPHWNLRDAELKEQIGPGEVAHAVAWSELNAEERRFQATKMAIHAAMIDRMDREIGRVLDQLKAMGVLDKTAVMFASDNGASAEFVNRGDKHDKAAELGSGGSFLCLGPGWSTVGNTPFRLHKSWVHEGGSSTPLIVQWPMGIPAKGELRHAVGHVIDIVPTVLELTGAKPAPKWNGVETPPLPGRSLVTAFVKDIPVPRDYLYFHHDNNRALRIGDWKLVSKRPDTNDYALYDLGRDRSEQVNLAKTEPGRVVSMARRWQEIESELRRSAAGTTQASTTPVEIRRAGESAAASSPPNILFVIADQWRAQAFGFAGDPNAQTPHLDRFERQCVNFTQAVAGTPVCSPTRASLLTGQRPQTHGVFLNDVPLGSNAVTWPKVLKAAGYNTGCIGKWHVDGHGSRSAFIPRERRQGFDYWKVLECTHAYNNSAYYADGPERLKWDGYDAIAQTRDAQLYLRERAKAGKPFLLWLGWGPPHNPYETAPPKYRALYLPENIKLPPNVPPSAQATARRELAGYYAHGTALDDCFADLLRTLDETGLATNTIVVFTSDHGDMLWSHDQQRKQRPWEESARVPMLFRLPPSLGINARRLAATINTEDVMPTLLSLCGQTIPKSVEGFDFTGAMRGGVDPSGGATIVRCISPFGEFLRNRGGREYRALRTARHTFVRDLRGPWLLYDNQADPYQLENLIGKPEHVTLQASLEALLKTTLAKQHDDFRPGPEYIAKWGYQVDTNETVRYEP